MVRAYSRTLSPRQVRAAFLRWCPPDRMLVARDFRAQPPFPSIDAAEDWIAEQTAKWTPALAVTAKVGLEEFWVVGGWAT